MSSIHEYLLNKMHIRQNLACLLYKACGEDDRKYIKQILDVDEPKTEGDTSKGRLINN